MGLRAADTGPDSAALRRRERQWRITLANALLAPLRLRLDDFQGTAYTLSNATGRTEVLDNLADLWPLAERLSGRPIDPLDPAYLNDLLPETPSHRTGEAP